MIITWHSFCLDDHQDLFSAYSKAGGFQSPPVSLRKMRADKRLKDKSSIKIAVPLFGERVSPYYGVSSKILLVETVGGRIASKTALEITEQSAVEISRLLVASGVNILICGGIQNSHKQSLARQGVWVVDNQKGDAEELLAQMIRQPGIRRQTNCEIRARKLKHQKSNANKRR